MSQSSEIAATQCELLILKGTQEGEEHLWSNSLKTPYAEPQGNLGCEQIWDTSPEEQEYIQNEWCYWAQTLVSSHM